MSPCAWSGAPQQLSVVGPGSLATRPAGCRPVAPSRRCPEVRDDLPPALREMIEQNRAGERQQVTEAHSLSPDLLADLADRARVMGVGLVRQR